MSTAATVPPSTPKPAASPQSASPQSVSPPSTGFGMKLVVFIVACIVLCLVLAIVPMKVAAGETREPVAANKVWTCGAAGAAVSDCREVDANTLAPGTPTFTNQEDCEATCAATGGVPISYCVFTQSNGYTGAVTTAANATGDATPINLTGQNTTFTMTLKGKSNVNVNANTSGNGSTNTSGNGSANTSGNGSANTSGNGSANTSGNGTVNVNVNGNTSANANVAAEAYCAALASTAYRRCDGTYCVMDQYGTDGTCINMATLGPNVHDDALLSNACVTLNCCIGKSVRKTTMPRTEAAVLGSSCNANGGPYLGTCGDKAALPHYALVGQHCVATQVTGTPPADVNRDMYSTCPNAQNVYWRIEQDDSTLWCNFSTDPVPNAVTTVNTGAAVPGTWYGPSVHVDAVCTANIKRPVAGWCFYPDISATRSGDYCDGGNIAPNTIGRCQPVTGSDALDGCWWTDNKTPYPTPTACGAECMANGYAFDYIGADDGSWGQCVPLPPGCMCVPEGGARSFPGGGRGFVYPACPTWCDAPPGRTPCTGVQLRKMCVAPGADDTTASLCDFTANTAGNLPGACACTDHNSKTVDNDSCTSSGDFPPATCETASSTKAHAAMCSTPGCVGCEFASLPAASSSSSSPNQSSWPNQSSLPNQSSWPNQSSLPNQSSSPNQSSLPNQSSSSSLSAKRAGASAVAANASAVRLKAALGAAKARYYAATTFKATSSSPNQSSSSPNGSASSSLPALFLKGGNNGSVTCDEYCAKPGEGSGGALVTAALGNVVTRAPELLGVGALQVDASLPAFGHEGLCLCESSLGNGQAATATLPPVFVLPGNNGSSTCDDFCNNPAHNQDMAAAFASAGYSGAQASRRLRGYGGTSYPISAPPPQTPFGAADEGYCLCEATNTVNFSGPISRGNAGGGGDAYAAPNGPYFSVWACKNTLSCADGYAPYTMVINGQEVFGCFLTPLPGVDTSPNIIPACTAKGDGYPYESYQQTASGGYNSGSPTSYNYYYKDSKGHSYLNHWKDWMWSQVRVDPTVANTPVPQGHIFQSSASLYTGQPLYTISNGDPSVKPPSWYVSVPTLDITKPTAPSADHSHPREWVLTTFEAQGLPKQGLWLPYYDSMNNPGVLGGDGGAPQTTGPAGPTAHVVPTLINAYLGVQNAAIVALMEPMVPDVGGTQRMYIQYAPNSTFEPTWYANQPVAQRVDLGADTAYWYTQANTTLRGLGYPPSMLTL